MMIPVITLKNLFRYADIYLEICDGSVMIYSLQEPNIQLEVMNCDPASKIDWTCHV
jgi:hypothetical protein